MSLMVSELYDALVEAGTSQEKARLAAAAVARYEDRMSKLEARVELLVWMVTTNIALTVAVLFKIFH